MIKTLQISSILAVILAAVLFVSSVVFGAHEDKQIEEFLDSPTAADQFKEMKVAGAKKPSNEDDSLLVQRAKKFASIINPTKPKIKPKLPTKVAEIPEIPQPKGPVKPKFRLFGTVVCESDPNMSLALLDEPGKGLLMVRQGNDIMHLTIELVKDGCIVVRDATGTFEMAVEEGPAPASVVPGLPTAVIGGRTPVSRAGKAGAAVPSRASIPPRSSSNGRRRPSSPASSRSRMTAEENARLAALGDRLKAAKDAKAAKAPEKNEAEKEAEAAAMIKKLMTDSMKQKAASDKDPNQPKSPPKPTVSPRRR